MEHKQTEAAIVNVEEEKGIVEAIWATMGNLDDVGDIIHPGAFTKTFHERGNQIKLLDNHRTDSVMSALGTVKALREVKRAELPQTMIDKFPEVNGGAWGQFQFLMDTPEGKGAFSRIKNGAVQEWSFGYDAVDKDYDKTKDGQPVRNLRQIKLYEVSPVLFPANSATTTTDAKAKPTEGKPYRAIHEGDTWNVYKLDEDGKPIGKPLGSHETEEEADAQVNALYANEDEEDKAENLNDDDKADNKPEEDSKNDKAGRVLSAQNIRRIKNAMTSLHEALASAGVMLDDGPSKSQETPTSTSSTDEAGPLNDKDTRVLKLIEIELEEMEV